MVLERNRENRMSDDHLYMGDVAVALEETKNADGAAESEEKTLAARIGFDAFHSPDALRAALEMEGILKPSMSLMKTLAKKLKVLKCCSCEFVADTKPEFRKHLKEKSHFFGQKEFLKRKRELMKRVKVSLAGRNLDHAFIPDNDITLTERLNVAEIAAWNRLEDNENLIPAEKATFHNLIHSSVCLVFLRRRS